MRLLDDPVSLLLSIPALLWALSFHEFCHGFAAKMVGDPTAERQGRLSLNPLAHFDLVGTLMLLFVGFGWAKPVPVNTRYFRHPRRDIVIVSLAGVAGNLLTATLTVFFLRFFGRAWVSLTGEPGFAVLWHMIRINLGLAAFNLIPIPPLDGSRVIEAFLPYKYLYHYRWLEQYGMFILLVLVASGIINLLFDPIFNVLWRLTAWPLLSIGS